MQADFKTAPNSPADLIVGPVDADTDVTINSVSGGVLVGPSSGLTSSLGGGGYLMQQGHVETITLRQGDSLYVVAFNSGAEYSYRATPR